MFRRWWFVDTAGRKRVTPHDPPGGQEATLEKAMTSNALMAVLGARWIKSAKTPRK